MEHQENSFDRMLVDHLNRNTAQIPHSRYGLDAVKSRIAADKKVADVTRSQSSASSKSLIATFAHWFTQSTSRPALALGVIGVQFAAIAGLAMHALAPASPHSDVRSSAASSTGAAAATTARYLRISFKPETTERVVRSTLNAIQGDIVAGPSQIGEYYVLTAQESVDVHLASLRLSVAIETADIVTRLP